MRLIGVGSLAYTAKFHRRLWRIPPAHSAVGRVAAHFAVGPVVAVGDVAKMLGYVVGRIERWRAGGPDGLTAAPVVLTVRADRRAP